MQFQTLGFGAAIFMTLIRIRIRRMKEKADDIMPMKSRLRFALVLSTALLLTAAGLLLSAPDACARKGGKFDKATAEPAEENYKTGIKQIREHNYEAALDSMQQAIYFSRNHYNPEAQKYMALCYKAMRNYPKAIQTLLEHLKQTTEPAPDARTDLAECYIETGEFDKARRAIDEAFRDSSFASGTHRQRFAQGEMYEKMGDNGQAIGFYDSAISQKPSYTEAWMAKARVMIKLKNYNQALKEYRAMLEKGPFLKNVKFDELYYNMGTCLIQRGDHQGALDHWRLALEANPELFDAHLALAGMLDEERHISSAIKEYQAALRTLPEGSASKDKIEKRLLWLEQQLTPKDTPIDIKPSPSMRREFEESERKHDMNQVPVPKDSGF